MSYGKFVRKKRINYEGKKEISALIYSFELVQWILKTGSMLPGAPSGSYLTESSDLAADFIRPEVL